MARRHCSRPSSIGRRKPKAVGPMPMQTRRVQSVVGRNLVAGLSRGQPTIDFSAFDVLTGTAFSGHFMQLQRNSELTNSEPSFLTPSKLSTDRQIRSKTLTEYVFSKWPDRSEDADQRLNRMRGQGDRDNASVEISSAPRGPVIADRIKSKTSRVSLFVA